MNSIFGPVNSRRLGRSLGIDLFSSKICNLNCVYCEVGRTTAPVCRRDAYSSVRAILEEIDEFCADPERLAAVDVMTVTAKGEPTLHSGLDVIIRHLKGKGKKPVAVLTNGTTLIDGEVRQALMAADIVIPSLDAARPESFRRVDRPAAGMDLEAIIAGLILFSHAYGGKIWLEILLVEGMNDAAEDIEALVAALRRMRLERIQLNTVVRPPAEGYARPVSRDRLTAIAALLHRELGLPIDLPFAPPEAMAGTKPIETNTMPDAASVAAIVDKVKQMVQRRPCTAADIDRTFHLGGPEKVEQLLEPLVRAGILQQQEHGGSRYYLQAV